MSIKKLKEVDQELYSQISGDEKALADAMLEIVGNFGKFGSESSNVYPNYMPASENEDKEIGVKCGNCVFHVETEESFGCSAIVGQIEEEGICRLAIIPPGLVNAREAAAKGLKVGDFVRWKSSGGTAQGKIQRIVRNGQISVPGSSFKISGTAEDPAALIVIYRKNSEGWAATETKAGHKFSTLTKIASLAEAFITEAEGYKVPAGASSAAKRALKWIADGKAGDGFTSTGRSRASQLASGGTVSRDTVARMKSYFARHGVDRRANGFFAGEKNYPSPGRVAWDAWGGDAGRTWVNGIDLEEAKKKKKKMKMY